MTEYEKMLDSASQSGLDIYENYDLSGTRLKGLYCDGSIALSNELTTEKEKKCVLAEEIGHHLTSTGDIIDQADVLNRKQELRARIWAYSELLPLGKLIEAYEAGCQSQYEIAKYLGVTEAFLKEAIDYYKIHFDYYKKVGSYILVFEPLAVMKLF